MLATGQSTTQMASALSRHKSTIEFMIAGKAKNRTAATVGKRMTDLFTDVPAGKRKTLTLDNGQWKMDNGKWKMENGKEFATHEAVTAKLNLPIYFARPYCSYERGTN